MRGLEINKLEMGEEGGNPSKVSSIIDQNFKNLMDENVQKVIKDQNATGEMGKELNATSAEIRAAQKILEDDEKTRLSLNKVDPRKKGKPPTMKDQLVAALIHLTPQLLGLAIGGAMEGEAGAVAGYEGAIAGQKGVMEAAEATQDMRAKQLDIQKDEQDLAAGPGAGELLTTNQKLAANLRMADIGERVESRGLRELQGGKRLDLKEETMRRLSPTEQLYAQRFQALLPELYKIGELSKGMLTGKVVGAAKDVLTAYGWTNLDHTEIQARIAGVLLEELHRLSGVAVRPEEKQFLAETIVPSADDPPAKFAKKLEVFTERIKRAQQQFHKNLAFYQGKWGWERKGAPKDAQFQGQQQQVGNIGPSGVNNNVTPTPVTPQGKAPAKKPSVDTRPDELDSQIEKLSKELGL